MKVKPAIPLTLLLLSLIATVISTIVSADFIQTINPDLLVYASIAIFIGITSFTALYAFLNSHKKRHKAVALSAYLIAVSMSIATIYQQIESPNAVAENKQRADNLRQINTQIKILQGLNVIASNDITRLSNSLSSSKYKTRDKANIRDYKKEINQRNKEINQQQLLRPNTQDQSSTVFKINYLHLFYACVWDLFALIMQLFARFLRQNKADRQSQEINQYQQIVSDLKQLNADASVTSTNLLRRNADANTLNSNLKQHQEKITEAQHNFDNKAQQVDQKNQQLSTLLSQSKEAIKQQEELKELQSLLNTTSQRCIDITDQSRQDLTQDQAALQIYQQKLTDIKDETLQLNQSSYQHLSDLREATKYLNELLLSVDKKQAAFSRDFDQHLSHWKQSITGINESINETQESMNSMENRLNGFNEINESINGKFIEFNESIKQSDNNINELNQGINKSINEFNKRFNGINECINETQESMNSMENRLNGFNEINESINGKFIEFNEINEPTEELLIRDTEISDAIELLKQGKVSRSEQGLYTKKSVTSSTKLPLSKVKAFKETAEKLGLLVSAKSSSGVVYMNAISQSQILLFNKKTGA